MLSIFVFVAASSTPFRPSASALFSRKLRSVAFFLSGKFFKSLIFPHKDNELNNLSNSGNDIFTHSKSFIQRGFLHIKPATNKLMASL